jgi:hypothetical protein
MRDLKFVELPDLFDMLLEQTAHYIKTITTGDNKEQFEKCREIMTEIQSRILQLRTSVKDNNPASTPVVFLSNDRFTDRQDGQYA